MNMSVSDRGCASLQIFIFQAMSHTPKDETEATQFLREHPEYDGRGVVVAIFDTGVDPGADGLQVCPDGRPKIIDVVDCTGSGDVDTSTIRTLDAESGSIVGLSGNTKIFTLITDALGRTLKLNQSWKCPSGTFRVGIKRAYEVCFILGIYSLLNQQLWPTNLTNRVKSERKKRWDAVQRDSVQKEQKSLSGAEAQQQKSTDPQYAKRRAELEARIEQLNTLQSGYDDPGPIYDCVVFHDGERWRAAVDVNEKGYIVIIIIDVYETAIQRTRIV